MSDSSSSNNNNIFSGPQQQQQHEEESTTFRSIPLGSAAAMRPLPAMSLPRGLAPLSAGKRSLALPPKPTTAATTTTISSIAWKVNESSIPAMPDYPLERTHMTCPPSLGLEQITQRIARVLEAQSLQCVFPEDHDDDREEEILPGRVDCSSSSSDLKFVVQLYKNQDSFVVEVQRRRGSAFDFSAVRKPLFQTLTTGKTGPKSFSPPSMASFTPNKKFRVMPGALPA